MIRVTRQDVNAADRAQPERIEVLGVPLDCVDMSQAVDAVVDLIQSGGQGTVFAVNPEKVVRAQQDPALLASLRDAALLIPDGIGMVWAARLLGLARLERVPGAELMPEICRRAAQDGFGVYLFGAKPDVNELARAALQRRYPGLQIVGHSHGYVAEEETRALIADINASGAAVLFVALGSPHQERWLARNLSRLRVNVCQGVGGTFDVLSGRVRRAPATWRNLRMEWAYRLLSQPSRLHRQTALPRFAASVLLAAGCARAGAATPWPFPGGKSGAQNEQRPPWTQ